jgi:hypothetical protein
VHFLLATASYARRRAPPTAQQQPQQQQGGSGGGGPSPMDASTGDGPHGAKVRRLCAVRRQALRVGVFDLTYVCLCVRVCVYVVFSILQADDLHATHSLRDAGTAPTRYDTHTHTHTHTHTKHPPFKLSPTCLTPLHVATHHTPGPSPLPLPPPLLI